MPRAGAEKGQEKVSDNLELQLYSKTFQKTLAAHHSGLSDT